MPSIGGTPSLNLTDYGERQWLGIPVGMSYTAPSFYIAASTTPIAEDSTGTELSVSGYTRQPIVWEQSPTTGGVSDIVYAFRNNAPIVFGPFASNTGILFISVWDSATSGAGNCFLKSGGGIGAMTAGQVATFGIGDILTYMDEDQFTSTGFPKFWTGTQDGRIWRALFGITAYPFSNLWFINGTPFGQPADSGYSPIATWGLWNTPSTTSGTTTTSNSSQFRWTRGSTGGYSSNFFGFYSGTNPATMEKLNLNSALPAYPGVPAAIGDTLTVPVNGITIEAR